MLGICFVRIRGKKASFKLLKWEKCFEKFVFVHFYQINALQVNKNLEHMKLKSRISLKNILIEPNQDFLEGKCAKIHTFRKESTFE
jgi:hypothetical protein